MKIPPSTVTGQRTTNKEDCGIHPHRYRPWVGKFAARNGADHTSHDTSIREQSAMNTSSSSLVTRWWYRPSVCGGGWTCRPAGAPMTPPPARLNDHKGPGSGPGWIEKKIAPKARKKSFFFCIFSIFNFSFFFGFRKIGQGANSGQSTFGALRKRSRVLVPGWRSMSFAGDAKFLHPPTMIKCFLGLVKGG